MRSFVEAYISCRSKARRAFWDRKIKYTRHSASSSLVKGGVVMVEAGRPRLGPVDA